ncbi:MAG: hypothetical protein ACOZAQ_04605 [Pseudomonadota bacterium]
MIHFSALAMIASWRPKLPFWCGRMGRCVKIVVSIIALLAFVIYATYRIHINDQGICIEKGRALTEDELKTEVIRNIVLMEFNNIRIGDGWHHRRLGIAPTGPGFDLRAMIDRSYQSGLSFDENFQVTIIPRNTKSMDAFKDMFNGNFGLVSYGIGKGGWAGVMDFSSIKKVGFSNRKSPARPVSSWVLRFFGYGNNFFKLKKVIFARECCDVPGGRGSYDYKGLDFSSIKEEAYKSTKSDLELWGNRVKVFAVNNCGRILTRKDDQNKLYDEFDPIIVLHKGDCE